MDRRAWQATVHRVKKSWIRLKQLSPHSVKNFFSEDCWLTCILILAKTFTAHIGLHVDKTSCPVTGHIWTSLVAQTVKNLPAMGETWVRSLGWEDPLEEGSGNPLQDSCLENPHGQRSLAGYGPRGHKELDTTE